MSNETTRVGAIAQILRSGFSGTKSEFCVEISRKMNSAEINEIEAKYGLPSGDELRKGIENGSITAESIGKTAATRQRKLAVVAKSHYNQLQYFINMFIAVGAATVDRDGNIQLIKALQDTAIEEKPKQLLKSAATRKQIKA